MQFGNGRHKMATSTTIQARIDVDTKRQAKGILDTLGISMSEAVFVYFKQIVMQRGIPFEIKVPNDITIETFEKTDAGEDLHRVSGLDELKAELKS